MKKRIEIVKKTDTVLQPIEVAIDEMQNKVVDIREVVNLSRPDLKKLQLKLQGSVSTQVNVKLQNNAVEHTHSHQYKDGAGIELQLMLINNRHL